MTASTFVRMACRRPSDDATISVFPADESFARVT